MRTMKCMTMTSGPCPGQARMGRAVVTRQEPWRGGLKTSEARPAVLGAGSSLGSSWDLRASRWRRGSPCTPVPMNGDQGKEPPAFYTHQLTDVLLKHLQPLRCHSSEPLVSSSNPFFRPSRDNSRRKLGESCGKTHLSQQVENRRRQLLSGSALCDPTAAPCVV